MDLKKVANITPSERQYNWQKTEFYGFAHFGVNTYTNMEWGLGNEDPKIFNPVKFDANQWVEAVKAAGMRGLILTAKHHDGFCLWQSRYTEHCIKNSPYKGGRGDIVKEVSEACKKGGIKFGVYLSPWDRHEKTYGDSDKYNKYYKNQLVELLTNYGEMFSIWFDGACGEGPNGKRQEYDWKGYIDICRHYQPHAVTFNIGDIRWCGNEAGDCRDAEWSVLPLAAASYKFIFDEAQKEEDTDGSFRKLGIKIDHKDLGSRRVIADDKNFIWYPCETDTSIRPGWFYHPEEDDKVRSLDTLLNIYYRSVGGNSTLLLNIPPNTDGLFHENDVKRLQEIGQELGKAFKYNFSNDIKSIKASSEASGHEIMQAIVCKDIHGNDDKNCYFTPESYKDGDTVSIDIEFDDEKEISKVVLMENIRVGQRIERFEIICNGEKIYSGETVGYKKIALFDKIKTDKLTINILESRTEPTLNFIGIY